MTDAHPIGALPFNQDRWMHGSIEIDGCAFALLDHHVIDQGCPPTGHGMTIAWSGGLGDAAFEPSPGTWSNSGWSALIDAVSTPCTGLLIRPHWAHVISDGPSCRRLCIELGNLGAGIALSPASMLSLDMLEDLEEHLDRFLQHAGPHCTVVVLEDLVAIDDPPRSNADPPTDCTPVGIDLGSGMLPGTLMGSLIDRHVPEGVPIIARANSTEEVVAWLS